MKNQDKARVLIIFGGPSKEKEVSATTAKMIYEASKDKFDARIVEYSKDLPLNLREFDPHVVYPAMHGAPGEDGTLQGFLQVLDIPYVGSGHSASAFAMNKMVAKLIYDSVGLKTPRSWSGNAKSLWPLIDKNTAEFVVKPLSEGSAIGVNFLTLDNLEEHLRSCSGELLIEELIMGKEITAGILERSGKQICLPVIEITTPENSWYDYEHRYTVGLSDHIIPARISDEQYSTVQSYARKAHQALRCSDLSRSDFIVTENEVYILETNTLPGMTPTSLYPDEAEYLGISFDDLVCGLIENNLPLEKRH